MKGILGYLREIIGLGEDEQTRALGPSVKRNRDPDREDDPPVIKKYRTVSNHFPKVMPKEDEEDWMIPRRLGSSSRERIIPITLESGVPSTSTPTSQTQDSRSLLRPLEKIDFGRHFDQPSTSLEWRRPTLLEKSIADSEKRLNIINSLSSERASLFRPDHSISSTPRFKLSPKPPLSLDLSRLYMPSTSQNKFFKRTPLPVAQTKFREDVPDPFAFSSVAPSRESYKYFKSSQKVPEKTDELEIVEISDSEDHVYYVVKEPKRRSPEINRPADEDTSDEKTDGDEHPCKTCKSTVSRRTSPCQKNKFGRFKVPLSMSKARLNSFTPFWKSQKKINGSSPKSISKSKFLENTKAIAEQCFRLEDKKSYGELIRISMENILKTNPNKPSMFAMTKTQNRIKDLTSSLNMFKSLDPGGISTILDHNGTSGKSSPEEVVVISDSEVDQLASPDDSSTSSSVKIVPVNTLKQSLKDKSIASPFWMEELNKKYRNIRLDKKQEEEDRLIVTQTQSKANRELWFKLKEKHLQSLHIDLTAEEEIPKEVPLPQLSSQQQSIIQYALKPNPPNQVLVQKFNLDITRRDINTLAGLNWLNDEVINFYMNLINERCQENNNLPKVYAMNTFFYPKLMQTGQTGLRRWTRKVDIFSHNMIVAPIHLGVHWCVSIIDFRRKTIKYFDSMGGKNMECCDALLKYLEDESMDKKKTKFDTSGWQRECVKDIPQQMNGSDCGMFSCTFAEFLSRDAPITFSQNDMPYLRRKMVLEIVQGKLLM